MARTKPLASEVKAWRAERDLSAAAAADRLGAQVGVADDTVDAEDACHAVNFAVAVEYQVGAFTHATITIEPLPPQSED